MSVGPHASTAIGARRAAFAAGQDIHAMLAGRAA